MSPEHSIGGISFQGPRKEHAQIQVTTLKNTQDMMSLSAISASFIVPPGPVKIY